MSRRRLDLERLGRHAATHATTWDDVDLVSPIDRSRPFLCETLTPLYYTKVYSELAPEHRLRYNQIAGMSANEMISFFETHFAQNILGALVEQRGRLPDELIDAMTRFAEDERRHTAAFRALNRLCESDWYAGGDHFILRLRAPALSALRAITRRPALFPAVLWIALVMEEKALALSRALMRRGEEIEPHYLALYRAHLEDEVRHVHVDWHMLDHLYAGRSRALRWANARLFCFLLTRFFLAPAHAGRRVVEILVAEHPELAPLLPRLCRELDALERDPAYHQMMYSRQVTPIAFELFDRFAEFRPLAERLASYTPALEGERA